MEKSLQWLWEGSIIFNIYYKKNIHFIQHNSKDGNTEAVLTFEKESAAKTALLLSNALIDSEHTITVAPYTGATQEIPKEEERGASEQTSVSNNVAENVESPAEEKKEEQKEENVRENHFEVHEVPHENITHRPEGSGDRVK